MVMEAPHRFEYNAECFILLAILNIESEVVQMV